MGLLLLSFTVPTIGATLQFADSLAHETIVNSMMVLYVFITLLVLLSKVEPQPRIRIGLAKFLLLEASVLLAVELWEIETSYSHHKTFTLLAVSEGLGLLLLSPALPWLEGQLRQWRSSHL
jgi:hypothetical protein